MLRLWVFLVAVATVVHGLQCGKDEVLKKYQLDGFFVIGSSKRETPPSTTTERWFINPCGENSKQDGESFEGCEKNDMLCGITEVLLPGEKSAIVTQLIDFSSDLSYDVQEKGDVLVLRLKNAKWGSSTFDAVIEYSCDTNMKVDKLTSSAVKEQELQFAVKGPSGCFKKGNNDKGGDDKGDADKGNDDPVDEKKSGISWFTFLILYACLFTFIYLCVVSYTNTRGGSVDDFRREFLERATQLFSLLPSFMKEVASKIFGSSTSTERAGYSAV